MLYLYLASNADGFTLALSPAAIRQAIGMPASTYRDQFVKLVDRGYLVQRGEGSTYDFYEAPQRDTCEDDGIRRGTFYFTDGVQGKTSPVVGRTAQNREINKINKENNMSVKTTGMKPEEMKRNLWVIYRSLPNGMNEEEYNTILTLV